MVLNTKYQRENWIDENAGASDMTSQVKAWTSLWHTKVPSKQKFFAWRLAQHSVPTADVLHHRNMSQSPLCALCGAPDSWRHALLDCTMSRCI
uniref:Reverse transcriptase zinc-binding domain-containing protein n=1 Tax=Triticum urartu TaxID=4572 RepID=A0A8R7R9J1_TRIUA